jgi:hypothetical protein
LVVAGRNLRPLYLRQLNLSNASLNLLLGGYQTQFRAKAKKAQADTRLILSNSFFELARPSKIAL